jgi:hypothetical protein
VVWCKLKTYPFSLIDAKKRHEYWVSDKGKAHTSYFLLVIAYFASESISFTFASPPPPHTHLIGTYKASQVKDAASMIDLCYSI